jgi:hypothetical protein
VNRRFFHSLEIVNHTPLKVKPFKSLGKAGGLPFLIIGFLRNVMTGTLAKRIVSMILIAVGISNDRVAELTVLCGRSVQELRKKIKDGNADDGLFHVGGGRCKGKLVKGKLRSRYYNQFELFWEQIDSIIDSTDNLNKGIVDRLIGEKVQLFDDLIASMKSPLGAIRKPPKYLAMYQLPSIEAGTDVTNNPVELAIRQCVLDRSVTQGSRGTCGQ